jgi:lipopolysaccharide/colanic/teichoic acid biosynthesis glycosyltransferase/glycosyltransferase involved in cell wall biosynthesis
MNQLKRPLDFMISFLAVLFLAPLLLILCVWIKLDSPGPVFFRQKRIGIHKSHFDILKFRTMRTDTPKDMPTHLLENPELYITKAGKFLRKTSLDELPQLFNILKGDMSIVGPRPALWNQYDLIKERDRYGANDIMPGLTGWAQIHGRDTISIREKAELDGYYVEHGSLWLDIRCVLMTALSVLRHEGVQEGGTGPVKIPTVSVVIATYHRSKELKRALASLRNQTYPKLEVILVDDNAEPSWNETVCETVRQWNQITEIPLKLIQNKKNLGSAASRNEGIKVASGEYITFLDDDDKYCQKKAEHQVFHMMEQESDYSITDLALYNEKGRLEEKRTRKYLEELKCTQKGMEEGYGVESESSRLLAFHLMYHLTGTDTLMFRKKYLEQIGGFPPIDIGDEFYLMKEAICGGGRFSYLPVCEVKALVHSDTEGLSSREGKIAGENELFRYKRRYFSQLKRKEVRQIKMRHHLVLAYAYMRNREYTEFLAEGVRAVLAAPAACIRMVLKRG